MARPYGIREQMPWHQNQWRAGCQCDPPDRANWEVTARHGNRSAFNGYHWTPSAYSGVRCRVCKMPWRTKAKYVEALPDAPTDWWKRG